MKKINVLIFFCIAICVLIIFHHYIKHKNDFHLTENDKIFQISDVSNHESFVFLFVGILLVYFYLNLFKIDNIY